MRLLLDTHALLWVLTNRTRITPKIRALLLDRRNQTWASAASFYETAVKYAANRRHGPPIDGDQLLALTRGADYPILSISPEHAVAAGTTAPFHPDPFDRLLLAQAQVEGLQLVTHDEALAQYDSRTILF